MGRHLRLSILRRFGAIGLTLAGMLSAGRTSAAVPEGVWAIPDKVAVRVFDCEGSLCGQVVWLSDPALRTPAICGRTIIWGLRPSGPDAWSQGWFFDPENGRTYNVTADLASPDTITAQIYLGVPFLGRTETFHRTSLERLSGVC